MFNFDDTMDSFDDLESVLDFALNEEQEADSMLTDNTTKNLQG